MKTSLGGLDFSGSGRLGGLFGLEGFNCKIVCQGSESEEEEAAEKSDDEEGVTEPAATRAPTTYPRPTPTPERPKVKYWPRPVQTRPARKGNRALVT